MLKVLFVLSNLDIGGVPSSLKSLCNHLKDEIKISIFALSGDNSSKIDFGDYLLPSIPYVDAYHCNFASSNKNRLYKRVIKLIKRVSIWLHWDFCGYISRKACRSIENKYDFDVIVSYQEGSPTSFCQYFANPNKVAWIHCDYSQSFPNGGQEQLYLKYKRIVNVSKYCMKQFLDMYPKASSRTSYIYNYFDRDRVIRLSNSPIENKSFKTDKFCIVSIGRIVPLKRYSSIPSIAKSMKGKGADFRWYILGSSTDLAEQNKLQEEIVANDVQDSVIWLGGQSNPYNYLKNSDLLVSLSTTEACPMIFNEARVLNIPIVTTDFGSSYEFIKDGRDGIIVPFTKLDTGIYEMITNQAKYLQIKNSSGGFIIDNNQITMQISSLLNECAQKKS